MVEKTGASTISNSVTYAGYEYDKETGLYYLNSRMYEPTTARFLQEDTYTGDPNDPLSLNLYTYCKNEPIMYFDPSGHDPELDKIYGRTTYKEQLELFVPLPNASNYTYSGRDRLAESDNLARKEFENDRNYKDVVNANDLLIALAYKSDDFWRSLRYHQSIKSSPLSTLPIPDASGVVIKYYNDSQDYVVALLNNKLIQKSSVYNQLDTIYATGAVPDKEVFEQIRGELNSEGKNREMWIQELDNRWDDDNKALLRTAFMTIPGVGLGVAGAEKEAGTEIFTNNKKSNLWGNIDVGLALIDTGLTAITLGSYSGTKAGVKLMSLVNRSISRADKIVDAMRGSALNPLTNTRGHVNYFGSGVSEAESILAKQPIGRNPIFADNDFMIAAAEKGNAGALAEIRGGTTYITPNQYREFLNVSSTTQRNARTAFLKNEGIQVFGGKQAGEIAKTAEFQQIFKTIEPIQGRGDAALGAFAKATGYEAVTMERRLSNLFNSTYTKFGVPIRRFK